MSSCDNSNIRKNYIVQGGNEFDIISACTGVYTNNLYNCTGDTITVQSTNLSANTINATVYLSGGTNLLDIFSGDSNTFVTGFTYDESNNLTISRSDNVSFGVNITEFSGITVNGVLSACTGIYTSNIYGCSPITVQDNLILNSGLTFNTISNNNTIDRLLVVSTGGTVEYRDVNSLMSGTTFVTGFTYDDSNNLTIIRNDGVNLSTNIDIMSGLTINGDLLVTGTTNISGLTSINNSLDVYNGTIGLRDNDYFLQGTSTGGTNVQLIGVFSNDEILIGNQGYVNRIMDNTIIKGELDILSGLTLSQTPTLNNSGTDILIRNSSTGEVEYRPVSGITPDTNTFTTGFTYDDVNTFTISRNDGVDLTSTISVLSGITYYGDGSNLSGITTTDTFVSGGTYNSGTNEINFVGNSSETTFDVDLSSLISSVSGDTFVVSGNADVATSQLTFTYNTGGTFTVTNSAALFSDNDINVTGGTYDNNTGCVTFTTNSGTTFDVCGFVTGLTDTFTTGSTLVGETIQFDSNILGLNYYNVSLSPVLSGKTDNSTFNSYTSNTETILNSKVSGATNLSTTGLFAQKNGEDLEFKGLTSTGGSVTITTNSTTVNLESVVPPATNTFVTGGTYNESTDIITLTRNDAVTIDITGVTDTFTTGATYDNGTTLATFTKNNGTTYTLDLSTIDVNDTFSTGGTVTQSATSGNSEVIVQIVGNDGFTPFNITGLTDTFVTGTTFDSNQAVLTRNDGVDVFKFSGGSNVTLSNPSSNQIKIDVALPPSMNTFTTGFTYDNANTFTIERNDDVDLSATINVVTGLTVNGTLVVDTLSATTYTGLTLNELDDVTTGIPTTPDNTYQGRVLYYDVDTNEWLSTEEYVSTGTVTIWGKKGSAGTISKGLPVYIVGFDNDLHEVELANASTGDTMPIIGFTGEDFDDTNIRPLVTFGKLTGLNTTSGTTTLNPNGETWSVNDVLYMSTTTGGLTKFRPIGTNTQIQRIAKVLKVGTTDGQIFIFNTARTAGLPNLTSDYLWVGNGNDTPQEVIRTDVGITVTGFTYNDNNTFTITDDNGGSFSSTINQVSGFTVNGNLVVTGTTNISGITTVDSTLQVDGNVNITSNSFFLQGTSVGSSNVSLIGIDSSDIIRIGNLGYNNYIADDTTINGVLTADTIFLATLPTLNNSGTDLLVRNTTTGEIEYRPVSGITPDTNTFVTGSTVSANTLTISRNDLQDVLRLSGGTNVQFIDNGNNSITVNTSVSGGGASVSLPWKFSTNTTEADPSSKFFRLNNSVLSAVTEIYVNDFTNNNIDSSFILSALEIGDNIYIQQNDDATKVVLFSVSAATIDNTGWFTIPVEYETGGDLFYNNKECGWVLFSLGAQNNTASNVGVGQGVFKQKTGNDFEFYSLSGGTNTTVNLSGDTIVINSEDTFTTGSTYDNGTALATFTRNDGNTYTLDLSTIDVNDTFVTGFTYDDANTLTISRNDDVDITTSFNIVTGLTVNGDIEMDNTASRQIYSTGVSEISSIQYLTSGTSIQMRWDGGGDSTVFNVNNTDFVSLSSTKSAFGGLSYGADYSLNYSDRSLIDLGYFNSNNRYVTGGTYNNSTALITYSGANGFPSFTVDLSSIDVNDTFSTGGTVTQSSTNSNPNQTVQIVGNDGFTPYNITGITDNFVTGFTYDDANTFTLTRNDGVDVTTSFNIVTGLTVNGDLTVTGETSLQSTTASTLTLSSTPTLNNSNTEILSRNSSTGVVEYKDVSTFGGGINITRVTGTTYTATTNDVVIGVDTSVNTVTLYLPDSTTTGKIRYEVKDIGFNSRRNPITITATGTDLIFTTSSNKSFDLSADGGAVILVSTGDGEWWQM